MEDERSLYINQIINYYRKSVFDDIDCYTVSYRYPSSNIGGWRILHHNEGLDVVSEYIKDLEKKVEELQYVEKIIQIARRTTNE
jgi:hypothetical protein